MSQFRAYALLPLRLPYAVFRAVKLAVKSWQDDRQFEHIVAENFALQIANEDKFFEPIQSFQQSMIDMADQGSWSTILTRLDTLDQTGAAALAGSRKYVTAMNGILHRLNGCVATAQNGFTLEAFEPAKAEVEYLSKLATSAPDNHLAAAISAGAHMLLGWGYRGDGWINDVSSARLEKFAEHYETAETLLAPFDAVALNSPTVAMCKYRACTGLAEGQQLIRERYWDWLRLDPYNLHIPSKHAFYMLPRWFGTYAEMQTIALQTAKETADQWGDGAYAAFYLGALECDPETAAHLDHANFRSGLKDIAEYSENDQVWVNKILWMVNLFASGVYRDEGVPVEEEPKYQRLFDDIVRNHFQMLLPSVWDESANDCIHELAKAFRTELTQGSTVTGYTTGWEIQRAA